MTLTTDLLKTDKIDALSALLNHKIDTIEAKLTVDYCKEA